MITFRNAKDLTADFAANRGMQPIRSHFASLCHKPILTVMALQLSGTSEMALPKSIDRKKAPRGAMPALTSWNFVRAASLANLLVATLVFVEFSVIAIVNHDDRAFQLGLWLVPFVTLVIWGTAAVLCLLALAPRCLPTLGRRLIGGPVRSPPSDRSGVWDDWLDSPDPQDS